jgi:hypothetical protein
VRRLEQSPNVPSRAPEHVVAQASKLAREGQAKTLAKVPEPLISNGLSCLAGPFPTGLSARVSATGLVNPALRPDSVAQEFFRLVGQKAAFPDETGSAGSGIADLPLRFKVGSHEHRSLLLLPATGRASVRAAESCHHAVQADHMSTDGSSDFVSSPGLPFHAQELLGELRTRLSRKMGHRLTTEQIARLIGQPVSTTHFWLTSYKHPHLLGFLALLEYLSPGERETFLGAFCRILPTLGDPRILGAPRDLALLLKLVRQREGLTVITGAGDRERTFVLTAIGHSYCPLFVNRRYPAGIDLHSPTRFVPVPAVKYLAETASLTRTRELILDAWPKVLTSEASLLLFNRLWSRIPVIRADLLRLARRKHVVLADDARDLVETARGSNSALCHTFEVSPSREISGGIHIVCHRSSP